MPTLKDQCEAFFDKLLAERVAPGVQYCIYDKDRFLVNGSHGYAKLPNQSTGEGGIELSESTIFWLASCSKLGLSLIVLHILDRNLALDGSTFSDLDDPAATLRLLPEFKPDSQANVSKLITGWEGVDPSTGRVKPTLVPRKTVPTIRQLLSHTGGQAYFWDDLIVPWYKPTEGEAIAQLPFLTGKISDFDSPSIHEAGIKWNYGPSSDWLGQWAVRATGKTLRQLYKDILFSPLRLDDSADLWFPADRQEKQVSGMFAKDQQGAFVQVPFAVWTCEDRPPEGYAHFASAAVYAPLSQYAKIFQACMRRDDRILSAKAWELALSDSLTPFGIPLPKGVGANGRPDLAAAPIAAITPGGNETATLLSTFLSQKEGDSGKPAGSQTWFGLANTFFSFNEERNLGYFWGGQVLPFGGEEWTRAKDDFEKLVFGWKENEDAESIQNTE